MGRKRKKQNTYVKGYFYEKEEQAVIDYINAETADEKNKIFEESLKPPFEKMIEIIIRRYKLQQKGESFDETFNDALAFIITKIDRYKQDNGRAYSYIQTICKNHLIGKRNDSNKELLRNVSYDDFSEQINENEELSYMLETDENQADELVKSTISEIDLFMSENKDKLNRNEMLVGTVIVEILKNWNELFSDFGSNKFNKSSILLYIKEVTNLPTKDIRNAMKKFKVIYSKNKELML